MSTVIAYGTDKQAYFDLFIESCHRHNIDPVILGWGDQWIGSGKKVISIYEFIQTLPSDETIISVDPFDVIFLSGLDEIESKFCNMKIPFLCGALKLGRFFGNVYNLEFNRTKKPTPRTPTSYDFLNAGTWISKADYACRLFKKLIVNNSLADTDIDQRLFTGIYIRNRSIMNIDWGCKIFHNLLFKDFITRRPDLKDLNFNNTRILNTVTGSSPCILHASGNTKMREIALALGYDQSLTLPQQDTLGYSKKAFFQVLLV